MIRQRYVSQSTKKAAAVTTVVRWTGREALALRQARRMSVRAFAAHLGVTVSSVSNWEQRGEKIRLRDETQQILDRDISLAPAEVQDRFEATVAAMPAATAREATQRPGSVPARTDSGSAPGIPVDLLGFVADMATLEDSESQAVSLMERRDFTAAVAAIAFGVGPAGSLHDRLSALLPGTSVDPPRRVGQADVERIEAATAAFGSGTTVGVGVCPGRR